MDFTDQTYSFIQQSRMFRQKGSVTVGISGGADSVCLFLQLIKLRERLGIDLRAVTVEHGIRGDASVHDAAFSQKLCEKYGVECAIVHVDAPARAEKYGISLEEAARQLRYEAFFENTDVGDFIALAHHMEDQAETVMFHMIRGSGVRGLMGMRPITEVSGRYIVRPLLTATKQQILDELRAEGQEFCTDATNDDVAYARNRIRTVIVPELEKINKGAVRHICESAESVGEMYDRFFADEQEVLSEAFTAGDVKEDNVLDVSTIKGMDDTARRLIIMEYLRRTLRSIKDVGREHLKKISGMLAENTHFSYDLPAGARLHLEYDRLYVTYPDEDTGHIASKVLELSDKRAEHVKASDMLITASMMPADQTDAVRSGNIKIPSNRYEKWLDYDKIGKGVCIRGRRDGDFFIIDTDGHRKSFTDYCKNEKIPERERDLIPLVVSESGHIAWAVGYRISEDVKVTQDTQHIMAVRAEKTD